MNIAYNRNDITYQWRRTDYGVTSIRGSGSLYEGKLKLDSYLHHLKKNNKKPTWIKGLKMKVKIKKLAEDAEVLYNQEMENNFETSLWK